MLETPDAGTASRQNWLLLAVAVLIGGFHLLTLRPGQEWGDDFALYVAHARNLAEGRPFADTGYLYNPGYPSIAPSTYPPIFPVLLTPVCMIFGVNLAVMKAFVVLLFMLALWVIGLLLKRHLPFPYALGCVALFGLNPLVWQIKDRLLSEMPYVLLIYSALLAIEKAQAATDRRAWLWGGLAGVLTFLAYGTRQPGLLIIPSLLVYQYFTRNLGRITVSVLAAFAGCFLVQALLLRPDASVSDQLVLDPLLYVQIAVSLVKAQAMFVDNGYSPTARLALYLVLMALALPGFILRARRHLSILEPFVVFNFLLLSIFPYAMWQTRYLLPLLPLFFLYVGSGWLALAGTARRRIEQPVAATLALTILASYGGHYSQADFHRLSDGVTQPEAVELFDYVQANSRPDDVFVFSRPKAFALFTGRRTSVLHQTTDEQAWEYLRRIRATHVVLGTRKQFETTQTMLGDFLARQHESFRLLFENRDFVVYEIVGDDGWASQR